MAEPFHLGTTVNCGSQITDFCQGLIVIDGRLLRAHHRASEATSGSEEVGWVGEWAAEVGDERLLCPSVKCHNFPVIREQNHM